MDIYLPVVIFLSFDIGIEVCVMGQLLMWVVVHQPLLQAIGVLAVDRFIEVRG